MSAVGKLIEGYKSFCQDYFSDNPSLSQQLASGQAPEVLFIACSDSRVDPAILMQSQPGELFVIRNVANIVPPASEDYSGQHGVSAAAEYAVKHLKVRNIVVLGHSQCGGIAALVSGDESFGPPSYIGGWVSCMREALDTMGAADSENWSVEEQRRFCEEEALKISLKNLRTYSWISEAVEAGSLSLHAWHYDLGSGYLSHFDPKENGFVELAPTMTGKS